MHLPPCSTGVHFWRTMSCWGKHVDIQILPLHTPNLAEAAEGAALYSAKRAFATHP